MAAKLLFMTVVRELVRCYQAFEMYSSAHIRELDLTPSQFDIIATLGNTKGMTSKCLGERTLITKGTLTGVVDRLIAKDLVRRVQCEYDGRSQIVQLTPEGEAMFDKVFPAHIEYMKRVFVDFREEDLKQAEALLMQLHRAFDTCERNP